VEEGKGATLKQYQVVAIVTMTKSV